MKFAARCFDAPTGGLTARIIDPPPTAGAGVHRWALYAANRARVLGWSPREAAGFVLEGVASRGRSQAEAERETKNAIEKAFASSVPSFPRTGGGGPVARPQRKAEPDAALIESVLADGFGTVDLWEASPVRFEKPRAAYFLHELMGSDPETLVCLARAHPADARTMPLADALPLADSSALCVPSPMAAPTGLTQGGRESPRCLANVGPRRWAVVEFDFAAGDPRLHAHGMDSTDACAALLWALRARAGRLAMVVHSGGKSLHGWFRCADWTKALVEDFFNLALLLGADPATKNRAQLVRMPDGRRATGERQSVLYFDPAEVRR